MLNFVLMKKMVTHSTSFLMILIILVSTLKISIYKMECLMSGNTKVSLSDFEDCNKRPDADCSISEKCCCFHQMDLNFDFQSQLTLKNFSPLFSATKVAVLSLSERIISIVDFNSFTNLPPPSGFDLLKIVQVFRL